MPETKKLVVAFDPAKPNASSSDFLIPWSENGRPIFVGLKSGKEQPLGMVVFVGRSISENDLFAKLVDSGRLISSVDEILSNLRIYVEHLRTLRIGNVVRIVPAEGQSFGLELVAQTPLTGSSK